MKRKRSTKILSKKFEPAVCRFQKREAFKLPNKKRNIQHGIRYANFGGIASLDHIRPRLYLYARSVISSLCFIFQTKPQGQGEG
jgi:hypothetical protein